MREIFMGKVLALGLAALASHAELLEPFCLMGTVVALGDIDQTCRREWYNILEYDQIHKGLMIKHYYYHHYYRLEGVLTGRGMGPPQCVNKRCVTQGQQRGWWNLEWPLPIPPAAMHPPGLAVPGPPHSLHDPPAVTICKAYLLCALRFLAHCMPPWLPQYSTSTVCPLSTPVNTPADRFNLNHKATRPGLET